MYCPHPLLLTTVDFNPNMDESSYVQQSVGCDYLTTPVLQLLCFDSIFVHTYILHLTYYITGILAIHCHDSYIAGMFCVTVQVCLPLRKLWCVKCNVWLICNIFWWWKIALELNSYWGRVTHIYIRPSLVQIMAHCPLGTNPLSERTLTYCQLNYSFNFSEIWIKIRRFP